MYDLPDPVCKTEVDAAIEKEKDGDREGQAEKGGIGQDEGTSSSYSRRGTDYRICSVHAATCQLLKKNLLLI